MFVKALRFDEVQVGDIFGNSKREVRAVFSDGSSLVRLVFADRSTCYAPPDCFSSLHHRSWPEGKSEAQMQEDILDLAKRLLIAPESEADEVVHQLREAIEEYELGK